MADKFAAIADLLSCPDDGTPLHHAPGEFLCSSCARRFPIHEENLAEILPNRACDLRSAVHPAYREAYMRAFAEKFHQNNTAFAWGAEETAQQSWACKRRRQVAAVQPLVTKGTTPNGAILCDIAAGAGYYTLAYAHLFRLVLHCDLSVDNLNYVWRKARAHGIHNIFFLRMDYFAPPFRQSLDRIICLDTLIRGEAHDSAVLAAIAGSLKPAGCAVVDFHNWWHNPARRLGLLPQNFGLNRSYTRREAEGLLRSCGVGEFRYLPFYQEFEPDGVASRMAQVVLPPTRHLFLFKERRGDSSL